MAASVDVAPHPTKRRHSVVTMQGLGRAQGWTFVATVRHSDDGPKVVRLAREAPEGQEVTPSSERRIPVAEVLRLAKSPFVGVMAGLVAEARGITIGSRVRRDSPTYPAHLRDVAAVYRTALHQQMPPHAALVAAFEVSDSTIERWLKDCREQSDPENGESYLAGYEAERAGAKREARSTNNREERGE
jgi:hypothetical protein